MLHSANAVSLSLPCLQQQLMWEPRSESCGLHIGDQGSLREASRKGPSRWPSEQSLLRYAWTTTGCTKAECMLWVADFCGVVQGNPTLKPFLMLCRRRRTYALFGCADNATSHAGRCSVSCVMGAPGPLA